MTEMEIFERAFASGGSGCRHTCDCGREFYDCYNSYDWEEGELEALEMDKAAEGHDYSVSTVYITGKEYCVDCDCWHDNAKAILSWMDANKYAFVKYLQLVREEKQKAFQNAVNPSEDLIYQTGPNAWRAIQEAPKAQTVEVLLPDEKTVVTAHWASDLSGDKQPPFEGWFTKSGEHSYCQITTPISWREINPDSPDRATERRGS